jgi:hypothetical protein
VAGGKKAGRAERRARAQAQEKLAREVERLARLAPGGSPEHPLVVDSPAVVDLRAVANPCPLCGGSLKLEQHAAQTFGETRLRVASVVCAVCGTRRAIYFRLSEPTVH